MKYFDTFLDDILQLVHGPLMINPSDSHVSELRLPPDEDVPDPLNLKKLPFNVVHGDGGVRHGDHVALWGREREEEKKKDSFYSWLVL